TSTGSATTVQCSKSKAFTVTAASAGAGGAEDNDGSLAGVLTGPGATIPYTLAYTSSFNGAGFGSATPTTLLNANAATVAIVDANAAEEGTYSDTVTITVEY
ncbi:MAG TPA: spore coat protein U domain-containing protein, partial [Smithella sp.]|nr:spore coat protein U domain-containing protein [Smithella sp.]